MGKVKQTPLNSTPDSWWSVWGVEPTTFALSARTRGRFSATYNSIQNFQYKSVIQVLVCMKSYLQTQFEFNPETFGIV